MIVGVWGCLWRIVRCDSTDEVRHRASRWNKRFEIQNASISSESQAWGPGMIHGETYIWLKEMDTASGIWTHDSRKFNSAKRARLAALQYLDKEVWAGRCRHTRIAGDSRRSSFSSYQWSSTFNTMSPVLPFDIIALIIDIVAENKGDLPQGTCSGLSFLPPDL